MNAFDYNPLVDAIMVSYVCPKCNCENNEFMAVPSPDLTAETAHESVGSDIIDTQCDHCGNEFRIELATSYNRGMGIIHGVERIICIEEDFPVIVNDD